MAAAAEARPVKLDEAVVERHLANAKERLAEFRELAHSVGNGKADHAVQYTLGRHNEIDRFFRFTLTEVYALVQLGGDERRKLEAAVQQLEQRLGALEAQPRSAYRGTWSAGEEYQPGDQVTCGGSLWAASTSTRGDKPGMGATPWRLCVKRGRAA